MKPEVDNQKDKGPMKMWRKCNLWGIQIDRRTDFEKGSSEADFERDFQNEKWSVKKSIEAPTTLFFSLSPPFNFWSISKNALKRQWFADITDI